MRSHLSTCQFQTSDVQERARNEFPPSPQRQRNHETADFQQQIAALGDFYGPQAGPSTPFPASFPPSSTNISPDPRYMSLPQLSVTPDIGAASHSTSPSPVFHIPLPVSVGSTASISSRDSRSQSRSRSRPLSRQASLGPQVLPDWNDEKQRRYETRLARLTASAGFPFSWVDNPEWLAFIDEFLPGAKPVGRKALQNRVIPATLNAFEASAKADSKGEETTLAWDGWHGGNDHQINAFMITVRDKVYTVRVEDVSGERKTAEKMFAQVKEVISEVSGNRSNNQSKSIWETVVVGVVSDSSGECRKARRLLQAEFPHLIVLDCYAHQINLIVGDLFKGKIDVLDCTSQAADLITYLRSRTIVLSLIRTAQEQNNQKAAAVLRAVLTRWTSHYLAYERLLLLRPTLKRLVADEQARDDNMKLIVTGKKDARERAEAILELIDTPLFWDRLHKVTRYLKPLAIAANTLQGVQTRLDDVLLTFAYIVMHFTQISEAGTADADDKDAARIVVASVEKRWKEADQEVFIAAVLLNPFFRSLPFAPINILVRANVFTLLERLFRRLFPKEDYDFAFHDDVTAFFAGTHHFGSLQQRCKTLLSQAQRFKQQPELRSPEVRCSFSAENAHVLTIWCSTSISVYLIPFRCSLNTCQLTLSPRPRSFDLPYEFYVSPRTQLRLSASSAYLETLLQSFVHVCQQHL